MYVKIQPDTAPIFVILYSCVVTGIKPRPSVFLGKYVSHWATMADNIKVTDKRTFFAIFLEHIDCIFKKTGPD